MNTLRMEIKGIEPREYQGKTSWYDLTDTEKQEFAQMRLEKVKESGMSQAQKQAVMIRGGATPGLSTSAAFSRYVERKDYWFR